MSRRSLLRARIWASGDLDPRATATVCTSGLLAGDVPALDGLEGDPLRLLPGPQERGELPLELACELSGSRMALGARGGVLSSSSASPTPCISSDEHTATIIQQ